MQYTEKQRKIPIHNKKDYLTCISTKLHVAQIFDNNLVAMRKSKLALMLNKPAYIEMCT